MFTSYLSPETFRQLRRTHRVLLLWESISSGLEGVVAEMATYLEGLGCRTTTERLSSLGAFPTDILIGSRFDFVAVFLSTFTDGAPPPGGQPFLASLSDLVNDPRVSRVHLRSLMGFAVYGFGDRAYPDSTFCAPAKSVSRMLVKLGCRRILSDACIDVAQTPNWSKAAMVFFRRMGVIRDERLLDLLPDEEDAESDPSVSAECSDEDVEDVLDDLRPMVSARHGAALAKQGYKVVGSHSAVKLCRWTKSQLRGRGGCYKHTFYGIDSSRCMEATPSLACANKCIFCWRHHKNPVGTSWSWKQDPADEIVNGSIAAHQRLVKELKGMVGVISSRFEKATEVGHCALSLVGEPVLYPEIQQYMRILHDTNISTFLVTNAQFPDQMSAIDECTQLYVSVDASNPGTLKTIDQPLFSDYWTRFLACLDVMRSRKDLRTVFRMTLVKGVNMQQTQTELAEYAELVLRGEPAFIEIKAFTYCGNNGRLTMENVPWHEEIVAFGEALLSFSPTLQRSYGIACVHKHSCCLLLARSDYFHDGDWLTWIDYPLFFEEVRKHRSSGRPLNPLAYSIPCPAWAVVGAREEGFDPEETRIPGKGKKVRA
ncbi:MAG: hypothetical protein KVP17_003409 [Porospora cf. gigantea B]|uniref:uncharacterized protein n=1 Tax=Porospora cf. gigantea B TaxID=2853592 RepID=UPI003571C75F|nr:MAG: hypothetical protein KVP17_003409 [Porospora cf. gigantea B]